MLKQESSKILGSNLEGKGTQQNNDCAREKKRGQGGILSKLISLSNRVALQYIVRVQVKINCEMPSLHQEIGGLVFFTKLQYFEQ